MLRKPVQVIRGPKGMAPKSKSSDPVQPEPPHPQESQPEKSVKQETKPSSSTLTGSTEGGQESSQEEATDESSKPSSDLSLTNFPSELTRGVQIPLVGKVNPVYLEDIEDLEEPPPPPPPLFPSVPPVGRPSQNSAARKVVRAPASLVREPQQHTAPPSVISDMRSRSDFGNSPNPEMAFEEVMLNDDLLQVTIAKLNEMEASITANQNHTAKVVSEKAAPLSSALSGMMRCFPCLRKRKRLRAAIGGVIVTTIVTALGVGGTYLAKFVEGTL